MICPSCNREMDKETVRYHTPSGYERKLVVFECPYDSCSGQDFTEDEIKIAAITTRLQEAEAIIKPLAEVAKDIDSNVMSKNWSDFNRINLCGDEITAGLARRAAAWLKGGIE